MQYYRRLPKFEYLRPGNLEEAVSLLGKYEGKVRILGGGTIVVHQMKKRIGNRAYVMGLKSVKELDHLFFDENNGLRIGAMTSLQSLADSAIVNEKYPMLAKACRILGTPQYRNMGTIGGNLCCRFATAECIPVLIALNAQAAIRSGADSRTVSVEDFFKSMKDGEILTDIVLPSPDAKVKWGYHKVAVRDHYDFATVSAAVIATLNNEKCTAVRLALGGVTLPTMRAEESEKVLSGQIVNDDLMARAAQAASASGNVGSDVYFSAEYKKELLRVVVQRALKDALGA